MLRYLKTYVFVVIIVFQHLLLGEIKIDIQYNGKQSSLPKLTHKIIKNNLENYQIFFGLDKEPHIDCIIAAHQKEFDKILGHKTPPWLAGVMNYRENRIILKSPELENISHQQYETTIKHELVHYLQNSLVPLSITPNWFDEGVAEYLVKTHDLRGQIILSRALNQEKLIPLDKLNFALSPNRTKSRLAYAESASLIDLVVIGYGEEAIKNILHELKNGATFSESWEKITGTQYDFLDYHWKEYIKKRYKWIFLLDFKYLIWLIMPVLLIIAYLIKKITNQKTIKEWDDEIEYKEGHIEEIYPHDPDRDDDDQFA
ncbi:MAG: hypothetical protein K9N00_04395 [Candidatus Marinimicrobia bacterium]|nr:hypothetical protein [Candidatus Neomarinimicrobiota bacterium]